MIVPLSSQVITEPYNQAGDGNICSERLICINTLKKQWRLWFPFLKFSNVVFFAFCIISTVNLGKKQLMSVLQFIFFINIEVWLNWYISVWSVKSFGVWILHGVMNNFKWSIIRFFLVKNLVFFFLQKEIVSGYSQRKSFLTE